MATAYIGANGKPVYNPKNPMKKKTVKKNNYLLLQASWPCGSDIIYGETLGDIKKKLRGDDYVMFKIHNGEIVRINKAGGLR